MARPFTWAATGRCAPRGNRGHAFGQAGRRSCRGWEAGEWSGPAVRLRARLDAGDRDFDWRVALVAIDDLLVRPRLSQFGRQQRTRRDGDLHVAPDTVMGMATSTGTVQSQLFLTDVPPLVGVTFYHQLVVLDAAGPITATNALQFVVGIP